MFLSKYVKDFNKWKGDEFVEKLSFEFRGSGIGYFWLVIWTTFLSIITLGLYFPWAYSAQQKWIASNTLVNGHPLVFRGTGMGLLWNWLLIMVLTAITFGLYTPWAYCRLKRWETDNTTSTDMYYSVDSEKPTDLK